MTPHGRLRTAICDFLKKQDAWYLCTNSQGYGRKGIPDIIGCFNGYFFAIEVKVLPDEPSPWQERELAAINTAKGVWLVAYSLEQVEEWWLSWTAH